ncbi:uncharacterized protein SPPG_08791 [Spizellomyces punctatus DAOM BR117]|uniref:Uncharacterized protein n=1 Tax=Spizellomyces punctatus (strain DAOM BR117) TaxID=645134 RepID=A0A0L0H4E6_SPIPD|nr:uncharacterized protein SPPG_08791 [Spizellomyces punctatus DAOM BR117]KNC95796.1 hypothetical protein SPPG_08791 [Spizellomyces punctatus DAOM BR117]|eukprot:XP_016603836.1 hypothetical protein SPPG_08791 [Spizellomyces punctatus DAOM BR117]
MDCSSTARENREGNKGACSCLAPTKVRNRIGVGTSEDLQSPPVQPPNWCRILFFQPTHLEWKKKSGWVAVKRAQGLPKGRPKVEPIARLSWRLRDPSSPHSNVVYFRNHENSPYCLLDAKKSAQPTSRGRQQVPSQVNPQTKVVVENGVANVVMAPHWCEWEERERALKASLNSRKKI